MFIKKLTFALLLGIPFFAVWYFSVTAFAVLMCVAACVGAQEIASMALRTGATEMNARAQWQVRILAVVGVIALFPAAVWSHRLPLSGFDLLALWLVLLLIMHMLWPTPLESAPQRIGSILLAALYPALGFSYLACLRTNSVFGLGLSLLALAISWLSDTFAYIGGAWLGRHKLYPLISPKKTREGLWVGMAAAALGAWIIKLVLPLPFTPLQLLLIGALGGAVGQIGDLCESLLKRAYGVKDAGGLIPGHGGVLDRFDSVLFVAPYLYALHRLISL